MTNRDKVLQLIDYFMNKTGFDNPARIVTTMGKYGVDIDTNHFYGLYRRVDRAKHKGNYDLEEIIALIKTFSSGLDAHKACTAFEAVLLCTWTSTGLEALAQLTDVFVTKEILKAIEIYLYMSNQDPDFNYFDSATYEKINQLLYEESQLFPPNIDSNEALLRPSYSEQKITESLENFLQPIIDGKPTLEGIKLFVRSGLYQKAEALIDKELELARIDKDLVKVAELQQQAGIIKTNQGDYESAERLLNLAYQNAEQAYPQLLLIILANQASNLYYSGEYHKAIEAFLNCKKLAEEQQHTKVYIFCLIGLGNASERLSRYEDANQAYLEALRLAKQEKLKERCGYVSTNLGNISLQLKNYKQASRYFNDAFKYAEQANDPLLYAGLLSNSSLLLLFNGERQQAKTQLELASDLTQKLGMKVSQLHILVLQGKVRILEAQYFEAIGQYINVIQQAITMNHSFLLGLGLYGISLCVLMQQPSLQGRTFSVQAKVVQDKLEANSVRLPKHRTDYFKENLKHIEDEFRLGIYSNINFEHLRIIEIIPFILR